MKQDFEAFQKYSYNLFSQLNAEFASFQFSQQDLAPAVSEISDLSDLRMLEQVESEWRIFHEWLTSELFLFQSSISLGEFSVETPNPKRAKDQPLSNPEQTTDQPLSNPEQTTDQPISNPKQTTDQPLSNPKQTKDQSISNPKQTTDQPLSNPKQTTDQPLSNVKRATDQPLSNPKQTTDQPLSNVKRATDQAIPEHKALGQTPDEQSVEHVSEENFTSNPERKTGGLLDLAYNLENINHSEQTGTNFTNSRSEIHNASETPQVRNEQTMETLLRDAGHDITNWFESNFSDSPNTGLPVSEQPIRNEKNFQDANSDFTTLKPSAQKTQQIRQTQQHIQNRVQESQPDFEFFLKNLKREIEHEYKKFYGET